MGNQLRALEAGLAVARVLNRILVVPDYISDNGEGEMLTRTCIVRGVYLFLGALRSKHRARVVLGYQYWRSKTNIPQHPIVF